MLPSNNQMLTLFIFIQSAILAFLHISQTSLMSFSASIGGDAGAHPQSILMAAVVYAFSLTPGHIVKARLDRGWSDSCFAPSGDAN